MAGQDAPLLRPGMSLVSIGDSFTEGVGDPYPDGSGFRGWADRTAEHLADHLGEVRYANLAVRGKLMRQIVTDQLPPVLEMAPDLVTLCAGGNDLLRPAGDPERMARILDGTVARLRANGSQVVLFTGVNIATGYMRGTIGLFARYYMNVRAIADRHGCLLVDQWSMGVLTDSRAWDADRLHMSPEGHRRLALRVAEVLGVPVAERWDEPWPEAEPVGRAEALREDLTWVRESLGPWIGRRLTGRSSGDTVTAKRPELTLVTKER
ncbi:SGNH/GDSL hydrolase family protein [Nocardiopsis changdeensis]|uniref:SGNH/GDSL hydrolase family protein n=1 Tax=Nocardiopsis changdeensis TaxID=2831969 RepID=A0ABX8BK24_9ACTN|nr:MULTISPECIES: SGNH/GDSL hydrolase family protein [Nocardiopsis]QUX21397.1 SGNH/GDSL hydrolase family protein [Nocardiopsis changdeensis]QYX37329.1 SGNH/GDSL hydrolase family protein [Nocardiopsis sp. MT53]